MRSDNPFAESTAGLFSRPLFAEQEFFEPSLFDAAPDRLYVPEVVEDQLLPVLERQHLILLGGQPDTDKLLFAKQLAWQLRARHTGTQELGVRQWVPSASVVQISSALDRTHEPTVFLFPGLEPHHLSGYDLRRFHHDLGLHGHKAILTTDSPLETWSASPEYVERALWVDIDKQLLTSAFLTEELILRLREQQEHLPKGLGWPQNAPENDVLIGRLSLSQVAKWLESPARIRSFVVGLTARSEVSEADVKDLLKNVADERRAVHHWFRSLAPRDQVLALGLALFDGLFDDQVFSSVETLMHEAWREWDPTLAHFDYHELERVRTYFRGFEQSCRSVRIECISDACRRHLLEVGWLLHRRRMCAALPVLESLARLSPGLPRASQRLTEATSTEPADPDQAKPEVEEDGDDDGSVERLREQDGDGGRAEQNNSDTTDTKFTSSEASASRWLRSGRWRDIFGNNLRNGLMRDRLANTVSEIGRLSTDAVEPILIELASDSEVANQHIAADAIARWRVLDPDGDGDRRLSRLLAAWRSESFGKEWSQRLRQDASKADAFARVRATIALALSHASLYDPPNRLAPDLVALLEKLLADRNPTVMQRMRQDAVPLLLQSHLQQLDDLAWSQIVPRQDLLVSAAYGIARAHYLRPEQTKPILERWLERARQAPTNTEDERRQRDHALAIVAYTYGLLIPDAVNNQAQGTYRADEIFGTLCALLEQEPAPTVRTAALLALIRQAGTDFDAVAPYVHEAVQQLTLEERRLVIEQLVAMYLRQRHERSTNDTEPPPDEYRFLRGLWQGLWIDSERPWTKVESVLDDWMHDFSRPVALQLAVECQDAFRRTLVERKECELREKAEKERASTELEVEIAELEERVVLRRLSFAGLLASMASLIIAPSWDRQRVLQTALPEVLRRTEHQGPDLKLLRDLWNSGKPNWRQLFETKTLKQLVGVPTEQSRQLIKRIGATDPTLARQLSTAVWIHRLRLPLAGVALFGGFVVLILAFIIL